jgi:sulfotransferase family protein
VAAVIKAPQLAGWVPVRLYWNDSEPIVDWCFLGEERFVEPFFAQTIELCLRRPFNLLFRHQTSISVLCSWREKSPGLKPSGFIFHMSRCGSTLVAQMLASLSQSVVVSEASPIDSVIRARLRDTQLTEVQQIDWLRSMISALGQRRTGNESHYFIKFDAWNTLDLTLIRKAFPEVPWIFMYRDPVEVLISQLGRRGAHMIPGVIDPLLFGMDIAMATSMSSEEYCASVLATICKAALEHHREGRLINYQELPEALLEPSGFLGVTFTASQIDSMRQVTKVHAKNHSATFEADGARKKQKANEAVREATSKWLYPIYEQLEDARLRNVPANLSLAT